MLGFPANNFANQEPGSNSDIKTFCRKKMKAEFDLFAKISVAGDDQTPLYQYLTKHADTSIAGKVEWNFQKYLVDRTGKIIAKFGPRTLPTDAKVTSLVEKALAKK